MGKKSTYKERIKRDHNIRRYARLILRFIALAVFHLIRYFAFPLLVAGSVLFLIGLGVNFIMSSFQTVDTNFAFSFSLLFSIIVSMAIFGIKTTERLFEFLWTNRKLQSFEKRLPKIRISIRTKILLKPYLLWLTVAAASLFFTFFSIAYSKRSEPPTLFDSEEFLIGLASYFGMGFSWGAYKSIYREREKAAYFFKKFSEDIGSNLSSDTVKPNLGDFKEALKSYQKALPAFFVLKDYKKRVLQTGLILNRGTKDEVKELQGYLENISVSIQKKDKSTVDRHFGELIQLLEKVEEDKQKILELVVTSKKERTKVLLQEMGKQVLYKAIPTLVLIAIAVALYMLWGYRLEI